MDIGESALVTLAAVLMVVAFALSFIPMMPGAMVVWVVAIGFAILEGFKRMTPLAAVIATLIMAVGTLSDFWLPLLGVKSQGASCLATIGASVGGLLGTFFIPIPILGTLIGCVIGALIAEFVRLRQLRQAIQAGRVAFKMFVVGYAVEVVCSLGVVIVFFVSLWLTR
jgi:uncharacterized protein